MNKISKYTSQKLYMHVVLILIFFVSFLFSINVHAQDTFSTANKLERFKEADKLYGKNTAENTNLKCSYLIIKATYEKKKGNTEQSEKDFKECLSLDKSNISAYSGMSHLYRESGRVAEIERILDNAPISKSKNIHDLYIMFDYYNQRAFNNLALNKTDKFLHYAEKAIKQYEHPKFIDYLNKYKDAITNTDRIVKENYGSLKSVYEWVKKNGYIPQR